MFRLTRQIRFSIADRPANTGAAVNGFGGSPAHVGFGRFFSLDFTLAGPLEERTSYLRNIKEIDDQVRRRAIPLVAQAIHTARSPGYDLPAGLFSDLRNAWPGATLVAVALNLTPTLRLDVQDTEFPMIRLSQKFEFSASHRLHNPALSDADNRNCFGKCNNPHGHGHNYEVQVTLKGMPDANGSLLPLAHLEEIVQTHVIARFDHKNLNVEVEEFSTLNPSVENISRVIYTLLKKPLAGPSSQLTSVTVWETPKTWCEYSE